MAERTTEQLRRDIKILGQSIRMNRGHLSVLDGSLEPWDRLRYLQGKRLALEVFIGNVSGEDVFLKSGGHKLGFKDGLDWALGEPGPGNVIEQDGIAARIVDGLYDPRMYMWY